MDQTKTSIEKLQGTEPIRTPPTDPPEPMLQFFQYEHLPNHLKLASMPFCDLAQTIVTLLPRNAERTVALRKLLEAKDAGVRAVLLK